jgi:tetratricopeptide (TPR) repeat protein
MEEAYELFSRARELLKRRENEHAAILLEKAKELEPHKGSILEALGRAYFNNGQIGLARLQFEEALEVDPTNTFARFCLGLCLRRGGKIREALGQFKLASVMDPGNELYTSKIRDCERLLENGDG